MNLLNHTKEYSKKMHIFLADWKNCRTFVAQKIRKWHRIVTFLTAIIFTFTLAN